MIHTSFGLGEAITVNAFIVLPTFKQWTFVLDINANRITSTLLCLYVDLSYRHAVSGFSPGVNFTKDDFVRPPRKNENVMRMTTKFQSFLEQSIKSSNKNDPIVVNLLPNKTTTIALPSDKSK